MVSVHSDRAQTFNTYADFMKQGHAYFKKTQTGHELNLFKPPYDAKAALWTTGRTPIEQLRQYEQLHHVDDLSALPDYQNGRSECQ